MYSPQMFEKLSLAMPLNEDVLVSGRRGDKSPNCEQTVLSGWEAAMAPVAGANTWRSGPPSVH